MHVPPPDVDSRVEHLDESVALLTSEIASLKLELATLASALRERQIDQAASRLPIRTIRPANVPPANRPSPAPAAIVVLLATGLLSWQLITGPRAQAPDSAQVEAARVAETRLMLPPVETEPPVTPLVRPVIYKGTLSVAADQPGARVFLNRREVGIAPVRVANLKAGAHLVWIESDGYRRWTRVVTVPAEKVTRVSADLEPLDPVVEHE